MSSESYANEVYERSELRRLRDRIRTLEMVLARRAEQIDSYGQLLDDLCERMDRIERSTAATLGAKSGRPT